MSIFDFGKQKIHPATWTANAITRMFSEESSQQLGELYHYMKGLRPDVTISVSSFLNEVNGAELQVLGLVCVHADKNLGGAAIALIHEYCKNRPEIEAAYTECNQKGLTWTRIYAMRGERLWGYEAAAIVCVERVGISQVSPVYEKLTARFAALSEKLMIDAKQYSYEKEWTVQSPAYQEAKRILNPSELKTKEPDEYVPKSNNKLTRCADCKQLFDKSISKCPKCGSEWREEAK